MQKICLTEAICNNIKEARISKGISSQDLASAVNRNAPWMSRIEHFKVTYMSKVEAQKLEEILDTTICPKTDDELRQKLNELLIENRRLKELLMEKWKGESK